ncbi:amidase [Candidatus Poriferisodalis sp.]|uniref:amidase n=1 Tax=Candidatus Poriferisodalis sp. TaxID=3101277 RepID=UPI003B023D67
MDVPDFRTVSVEALTAMVKDRTLTAAAVTEHALGRIEALNPQINAFVALDAEDARAQAAAIDERLDGGENVGPLAGIPIGVKDLADAAGFVTARGAMHLRDSPPVAADSTEVARMRAAGAVILGKTNTPEFGCMGDTYNSVFGATWNPWNLSRSAGGSSGGTAAAVMSGMVPVGTGSDGGGSIRIPSSICGMSGLKPSHGRVPSGPPPPGLLDLSCVGPMARRIRDVAYCLDALVGPHPSDLRSLPAPTESWRAALDDPPLPSRVLWAPSIDGGSVDSEIVASCAAAVERLAAEGVEVVEMGTLFDPADAVSQAFVPLFLIGAMGPAFRPLLGTPAWDDITDWLAVALEEMFEQVTVDTLAAARQQCGEMSMQLGEVMAGFDAMLLPTMAGQTPVVGGGGTIDGVEVENWVRFTPLANLTRRPASTVCSGLTADGMPIGLSVLGPQTDDVAVLQTTAVLEDLVGLDPMPPDLDTD